jgi:sulfur carrier protein ThiS
VRVEVTLKGVLAERTPAPRTQVELPEGAPVEQIVTALGLPRGPYVYVVNGGAVRRGTVLQPGDRVQLHPPVAGGAV